MMATEVAVIASTSLKLCAGPLFSPDSLQILLIRAFPSWTGGIKFSPTHGTTPRELSNRNDQRPSHNMSTGLKVICQNRGRSSVTLVGPAATAQTHDFTAGF